jgi:hypothetical protein
MNDLIRRARRQAPSWRSLAVLYGFAIIAGLAFGIQFKVWE